MENKKQEFDAPGYETLGAVLKRAYDQAAYGKGKERHANDEPFTEQVMQTGAQRFGTGALLFQAFKKSEESQRLPHDRAVAELLGAIVYLAGAVIAMEAKLPQPVPANDNGPWISWRGGDNPAPGCIVETKIRNSHVPVIRRSELFHWGSPFGIVDIVEYRIIGSTP